jgi:hypothetical protein
MKYKGSCHCGQIAFEVEGNLEQVMACNCSICSKFGALRWIVPPPNFRLLTPEENLATYTLDVIRNKVFDTDFPGFSASNRYL